MDSFKEKYTTDSEKVVNFLKSNANVKDINRLEEDLKKSFVLGNRRSRKQVNHKRTKKSKHMTRKEKDALGLFRVPRTGTKYVDVLPMNQLWKDYMRRHLELDDRPVPEVYEKAWENFSLSIYKADFHGATVTVKDSKCASLVGKSGICIMETKNTFKILSEDNIVRTVPKMSSVFTFHLEDFDFLIFGKHITRKPAERSVKVSKLFSLAEL